MAAVPGSGDGVALAERSVARFIVDELATWGCRVVFGVVGDAILEFAAALGEQSTIRFVTTRHEEAAALMASAYAKLTGEIAACTATTGPGAAHLVNGLADAHADRAGVIAITGQVPTAKLGSRYKQYIDQGLLFAPVTDFSATLAAPDGVRGILQEALRISRLGGVSHLAVPKDLWRQPVSAPPIGPQPFLRTPAASAAEVLDEAAARISRAERPMFLVGKGAASAITPLLELAERVGAGVAHTLTMAGAVPAAHPLAVGAVGEGGSEAAARLFGSADLAVRIGANWWPEPWLPGALPVLDIDVIPANVGLGVPPAFGLVGDTAQVLPQLLARVPYRPNEAWREAIARERAAWEARLAAEAAQPATAGQVSPASLIAALSAALPADAVICLDVGEFVLWFNRHFRGRGQWVLISGMWRSMGFGLPAAIAAALAFPERPVIALVGDGGLAMTLAEWWTALQHGLRLGVVVVDNGLLAMEHHQMALSGLHPVGTALANPDFAALMRVGIRGGALPVFTARVDSKEALTTALENALAHPGPWLIDVLTADLCVPTLAEAARNPALARA
ncbi:MAG TPA: thiamine pyrophosphate-binding protein [Limnochordia bacterium]